MHTELGSEETPVFSISMDAFQDLFCLRPLAQADNPLAELKESCPAVRHQRFECSGSFSDEAFAAF